jgi:hypothetical protein
VAFPVIKAMPLPCLINGTSLLFRVGVILNHILNHVLKKYFAEPRPMFRDVVFEVSFPSRPLHVKQWEYRSTQRCGSVSGLSRIWWAGPVRIQKNDFGPSRFL